MHKTLAVSAAALIGAIGLADAASAQHGRGYGGQGGYGTQISCSSGDYGYNFCPSYEPVRSAYIIDHRSESGCDFGDSWGFTREGVWVDDGCRAVFAINAGGETYATPHGGRGSSSGYGGGYGGGYDGGYAQDDGYDRGPRRDFGGRRGGRLASVAFDACEREGARRAQYRGARSFRFGPRADVDGAIGEGWRVSGPAWVETYRGRERIFVDCFVRRGEVISFNVSRR